MMLSMQGVHAHYGHIHALRGIDVEVQVGEIVTLIGANGAGKSTLMMSLFGSPKASAGRIVFNGEDITRVPTHEIARRGIALVPEGRHIFPRMTVIENLQLGTVHADAANYDADIARMFAMFPILQERQAQRAGTLSGGEQQMLAIGRALMTNPDVLILDEATEGLAPLIAREIWRICDVIRASGISSIIVDKNWKHVTQVTDRNVILVKGEVVFEGTSDALRAQPELLTQHLGV